MYVAFLTGCFPCLFITINGLQRVATEVWQLPQQLGSFSIHDSECFCCACNHVHPETGAEVPCDRELVYAQLVGWFRDKLTPNQTAASELRPSSAISEHSDDDLEAEAKEQSEDDPDAKARDAPPSEYSEESLGSKA